MASLFFRVVRGAFSAALIVSAATLLSLLFQATAVTAGFVYLISILVLTIWQGFVAGTVGSILAAACFNFLPDRARLDLAGWAAEDIFAHS